MSVSPSTTCHAEAWRKRINFQFSTVLREDLRPNEVAGLLLMFLVSIIFLLTHLADTALNAECWQPYPLNVGF